MLFYLFLVLQKYSLVPPSQRVLQKRESRQRQKALEASEVSDAHYETVLEALAAGIPQVSTSCLLNSVFACCVEAPDTWTMLLFERILK